MSIFQPEEKAGFEYSNVGKIGGASGVYLGNGWVLTAKHVAAGDITFGDTTYHYDGDDSYLIENPSGIAGLDSTYTDLRLYHLTEEPDLPAIKIATEPAPVGTQIYYVGYGTKQVEELSYWNVDTSGGTAVWTSSEEPTYYWGYNVTSVHEFSWGYNEIATGQGGPTDETNVLRVGSVDIISQRTVFKTQFLDSQVVSGDSGGGVFYQEEGGDWVLSGIICCAETIENQPTLAMVDSGAHSVSLPFYRDQILSIITSSIPGDANGDGVVDGSDVTILASNWQQMSDLGTEVGDFNGDGIVDGSDVTILAGEFGSMGRTSRLILLPRSRLRLGMTVVS